MATNDDGLELLILFLTLSEKAANIARLIRRDDHLIHLLTQEKDADEANPRFVRDFKTLADVLIQETVRYFIGKKFPELVPHINGEESSTFRNTLNKSITIAVKGTKEETAEMLYEVLEGDIEAAEKLAEEVHKVVPIDAVNIGKDPLPTHLNLPVNDLGIWIDPIDSTAEYIAGDPPDLSAVNPDGIRRCGLHCVTVLIGGYNRSDGIPVLGVVNQPFRSLQGKDYHGQAAWGVDWAGFQAFSVPGLVEKTTTNVIAISSSEDSKVKMNLEDAGFEILEAAGAGYKLLLVIQRLAQSYILTKDSTYQWDTCGPHAILRAMGGGIARRNKTAIWDQQLMYGCNGSPSFGPRNLGGFVAYSNKSNLEAAVRALNM